MMKKIIKELYGKYQREGFLFTDFIETSYLTGASFDGYWLLFIKDKVYAVCSKMVENQLREFFQGKEIEIYTGPSLSFSIAEILKKSKVNSIIVDSNNISASDFFLISERLKIQNIELIHKYGVLNSFRMVKTEKEIEYIKEACKIVSNVCDMVKSELKPGLTELDIHYRILELFAKNKVKESFKPIVAAGKNSANPHHISSNYKINENDIVMMDLGCIYKGYCSDLTRTYFLGKINGKFRKIWDIVKEAQNAVLKDIRSGLPIAWADKTARDIISAAGYGDKFIHTTGHGIGLEIHEMPSLSKNAEGFFSNNYAVTVEPGIYIEGEFGVRIEDSIIVREQGCEILTTAIY